MSLTCISLASMLGSLTNTMYPRNNFGALVASPGRNSSSLPTWWEFVQYVLATAPRRSFLLTPRKFQDHFDSPTGRMSIGDLCLSIALLAQLVTMSFSTLKSWRWLTWICDKKWNKWLKDEERLLIQSGFLKMGEVLKPQQRNTNDGGFPTSRTVRRSVKGSCLDLEQI